MNRLRLLSIAVSGAMLPIGMNQNAWADCPYRATTPDGQVIASTAPENSVVCVKQATPDCPQCQSGLHHQCTGGAWRPIEGASCGGGPYVAAPPANPDPTNLAQQPVPAQQGTEQKQDCVYYDKDGRRIELRPEDLAWAEDAGLVADKKCR